MFGYKFSVLSPHYVPDEKIDFFNHVYGTWKQTFSKLLEASGAKLDCDDLFRTDNIIVISHNNEIVSLATLTLFDIRLASSRDHHYMQMLKPQTCENLMRDNLNKLVCVEYLSVMPKWRRHQADVEWVEIMLGLSCMVMDHSAGDIVIGTPRVDVKVDRAGRHVQAFEIQEPITKMNYPCSVMAIHKQENRKFSDPTTQRYVKSLWENREEIGHAAFQETNKNAKKAA